MLGHAKTPWKWMGCLPLGAVLAKGLLRCQAGKKPELSRRFYERQFLSDKR
jgi:hypothetical protein